MAHEHCDVLILGGGPGGISAANSQRDRHWNGVYLEWTPRKGPEGR